MKRAAAALVLGLAGVGGCMTATPGSKPATTAMPAETRGATPERASGMRPVGSRGYDPAVVQANALGVDKVSGGNVRQVNGYAPPGGGHHDPATFGPMQSGLGMALGHGGILPSPGMGPWGAVALVPGAATGPGGGAGGMYANGRTSINFVSTPSTSKMRIGFQDGSRGFVDVLSVPQHYNFAQGNIYRLRLSNIPNRPDVVYYPTLEVYPAAKDTVTFLSHGTVPVGFTDEDFDQVKNGNMVVKVIYLPSSQFQDIAAAEEIVSTRLEPGADPVVEASRRGTILAVVRIGNANLENPNSPALDAPVGGGMGGPPAGGMMLPRTMPAPVPPVQAEKGGIEPKAPSDLPKKASVPSDLPKISLPPAKK